MRFHPRRTSIWFLVIAGVLVGACSTSSGDPGDAVAGSATTTSVTLPPDQADAELVFPGAEWAIVEPTERGIDETVLGTLAEEAEATGSTCLVVTRHGRMVGEWYWNRERTDQQEVYSVTKSFTSGLLGIASDEGHLAIDDPASDFLTEWQGTDSEAVLVEDLLQNDSGRYVDLATDYAEMANGAEDKSAFAVQLDQQYEPGTIWKYNNSAIQTLETVLERALDEPDIAGWGTASLLEPLGMDDSTWQTDEAGNALTFMGIDSTCGDMARYGLLWLADGNWDGRQIISTDYIEAALEPVPINAGYGYLWWKNDPAKPTWPSSPNAYAAIGLGGQFISVDPDSGLVVSRQALGNDGSSGGLINLAGTLVDAEGS